MKSSRRDFLKLLGLGTGSALVSPIKTAGFIEKSFSATKKVAVKVVAETKNCLLTPSNIAKEALKILQDNLVLNNIVHKEFSKRNPYIKAKGSIIRIKKPEIFKRGDENVWSWDT